MECPAPEILQWLRRQKAALPYTGNTQEANVKLTKAQCSKPVAGRLGVVSMKRISSFIKRATAGFGDAYVDNI